MSKIRDASLAELGSQSYQWARSHMRILDDVICRLEKSKPLAGITLGFSLQITKETAVLLIGAQRLGARVIACSGNPLSTQDDIAAFLVSQGVVVYACSDQSKKEFEQSLRSVLQHRPDIISDDGGELGLLVHRDPKFLDLDIMGATEETTTGVRRLGALDTLRYPVISVNDADTKHLFDNRYGTGQSAVDGYLSALNLLLAGKKIVVAGYGWVGRGVASRFVAMGSAVIVTEVDPVRALEACMDGFDVMPMRQAARVGDIFITCTGMTDVITSIHIESMKSGAVLGNVGHSDVEIDSAYLLARRIGSPRANLDECLLDNKKHVYLIARGRVANLIAAGGHPPEVMAQSFSNQLLSILYILKNHTQMPHKIIKVPKSIDVQIARDALAVDGISIDALSEEQKKYVENW